MAKEISIKRNRQEDLIIRVEDVAIVFTELSCGVLKIWLTKISDILTFLNGAPEDTLELLSEKQADIIVNALRGLADRVEKERR